MSLPSDYGQKGSTFNSWASMRQRCNDKSNPYYGGKGVSYDPRWNDYWVFVEDMGERPPGTDLDKDSKGDGTYYSKDTCCWLPKEQNRAVVKTKVSTSTSTQTKRSWFSQDTIQRWRELKQSGMTYRQLSEMEGVTTTCLIKHLKSY